MSDFEHLDYYELLGVSRAATPEEIKRAYRQEISKYHPDRFANASPTEQEYASRRSQYITEAYSILSDLASRTAYNRGQSAPRAGTARRAPPPAPQPRDHQAELYDQAREHIAADRLLQAIAVLRQLQQINPFYRDSADMLARAEAQLRARQQRSEERPSRRPLFLLGGAIGGVAVVALIALAVGMGRDAGATIGVATATAPAVALASPAPTEPPLPTVTPVPATIEPSPEAVSPTTPPTEEPASPQPTEEPTSPPPTEAPPTNAPTPAGETGALLLSDTFSSGGWANSGAAGWRVGYQGGRYRVAVDAGYGTIWSFRTATAEDYSIGVDVRVTQGEGGLLLRYVDARNYLSFSLNPSQTSYRLEQHRGGGVTVLAGGQSEAIQAGPEAVNRLVARLRGNHVELLVNGQPLDALDVSGTADNSRYGLLAIGGDVDAEAFFDNLQLRALE